MLTQGERDYLQRKEFAKELARLEYASMVKKIQDEELENMRLLEALEEWNDSEEEE